MIFKHPSTPTVLLLKPWKNRLPHLVAWGLACVFTALFLWLTQTMVQLERQASDVAARQSLANLSLLSQEHANRTLRNADQMVKLVRSMYLTQGHKPNLADLVSQGVLDTEVFLQVGIIDAKGIYRHSSLPNTPAVDLSDRAHFKVHVDRQTDDLFISEPVLDRVSNRWAVQLTRRITLPDGGFGGVAAVSMDANHFIDFYKRLSLGPNGVAALVGLDGVVRARRTTDAIGTGAKLMKTPALEMIAKGQTEGFFTNAAGSDGVMRLHHFRQLAQFPLYVAVAVDVKDIQALGHSKEHVGWWQSVVGGLLVLGLAALFSWNHLREQAQRRALSEANSQIQLALDGGGLGLWAWDIEHKMFTADDRLLALLGYAPGELAMDNHTFVKMVHMADWAAIKQALVPVLKGTVPRMTLEHRFRHKDGRWVWLMARGQVVARDSAGRATRLAGTDVDRSEQKQLELAAQTSKVLLQELTDQVPAELFQFKVFPDGHSVFPYVSKHFLDFYGVTLEQVQIDANAIFRWQHPDDADMIKASVARTVGELVPWQLEYRLKLPDGSVRWRSGRATPRRLPDGSVLCHGAIMDITERKLSEAALRVAAVAFESSSAMAVSDASGVILSVNQAFVDLSGYSVTEAVGQHSGLLKSGRQPPEFYQDLWRCVSHTGRWEGELWNRRKNGEVYLDWLAISVVKDANGVPTHYVSVHADITQRKRTEDDIRALAFFDPLTGLPNRRLLLDRLQQLGAAQARHNQFSAVLFIDMDRFKQLNDAHGHDQGDDLLIQVAKRLQACVREVDTVARLGGDEFVVALAQLGQDPAQAQTGALAVAHKILQTMAEPFVLPSTVWQLSCSVGLAVLADPRTLPEDLLKAADRAMYLAKAAGRNTVRLAEPQA